MNTSQHRLWEAICETEIATASSSFTTERYVSLCRQYAQIDLQDEAVRLSQRLIRLKADLKSFLPFVLDALSQQHSLKELAKVVLLAKSQKQKTPSLRRALAKAHQFMGQIRPAAKEWEALIANGDMHEKDWLALARFLIDHSDIEVLGKCVEKTLSAVPEGLALNAARLCTLCYYMGHDADLARARLAEIPPKAFPDADLASAVAVLAFRMAEFDYAEAAASHALAADSSSGTVSALLETIRAFGGKSAKLETIHVDSAAAEKLREMCDRIEPHEYAWGLLYRTPTGAVEVRHQHFAGSEDRALELMEIPNLLASFSCLPQAAKEGASAIGQWPDPLEVLPFIDYEVPHLMLQRFHGREQSRMHVFIGAHGNRDWCWKQVAPILGGQDDPKSLPSKGSQLWKAAASELRSRTSVEE